MVEQVPPILRLDGATLTRGGRLLFADLSLTLGPGEAALVTGANGVGKSSLLRLAAGLLRADGGQVAVTGACALLADQAALDGEATLTAALAFWARMDAIGAVEARVAGALDALALAPLAGVPVRLLSAGQRRRGAIARVVGVQAALWLLDEPANGLDAASVTRLEEVIAAHRAGGGAVVVATHQPIAMAGAVEVVLGHPTSTDSLLDASEITTSVRPELVEGRATLREEPDVLRQAQHERGGGACDAWAGEGKSRDGEDS